MIHADYMNAFDNGKRIKQLLMIPVGALYYLSSRRP